MSAFTTDCRPIEICSTSLLYMNQHTYTDMVDDPDSNLPDDRALYSPAHQTWEVGYYNNDTVSLWQ